MKIIIKNFFTILNEKFTKIFLLILFYSTKSFFEVLSIAMLIPLVNFLFNKEIFNKFNFFIQEEYNIFFLEETLIIIIILLFIFFFAVKSIMELLVIYINTKFVVNKQADLRIRLFKKTQIIDYRDLLKKTSAELIRNSQYLVNNFTKNLLSPILQITSEVILIFGLIFFLLIQNNKYIFHIIFIGLTFLFIYKFFTKKILINFGKDSNIAIKNIITTIQESFYGFKEIRLYKLTTIFNNLLKKNSNIYATNHLKISIIKILPKYIFEILIIITLLFLFFNKTLTDNNYRDTNILNGSLIAQLAAVLRMIPFFNKLSATIVQLRNHTDTVKMLAEELKMTNENYKFVNNKGNNFPNENFLNLSLKEISFSFDNKKVLNKLNLKIEKSQILGLYGPSGSGKTTLVDIICGLLIPNRGEMIFNNHISLNYNNILCWQKYIAYVPQNTFLINDTVQNNIIISRNNFDLKKYKKSLIFAALKNEINEKINIGEAGRNISGGQRKRIGIARAFYSERPIIILDETLSELDKKNKELIIKNIKNDKSRTLIIVSHDISILKKCDKIIKII